MDAGVAHVTARFTDAVAFIAGGTGAVGRAVSRAFVAEGARVVVTYRSAQELEELSGSVAGASGRLDGRRVNVTAEAALADTINDVVARYGRIDILVNTVGGYAGGAPTWQLESPLLERMLELNVHAGHTLLRAVVPVMLKQARGCIVNVAAKAALTHPAGAAAYAASKAAALTMMECLAAELLGTGVRANSILPSTIDTEANRQAMPKADFSKWPKPEDIAPVVLFLCSPESWVIHGAAIPVYGDR
jgi:NAD(P)-dependent dehydrogenase (short-subunit alcohol dehydrogenase family)